MSERLQKRDVPLSLPELNIPRHPVEQFHAITKLTQEVASLQQHLKKIDARDDEGYSFPDYFIDEMQKKTAETVGAAGGHENLSWSEAKEQVYEELLTEVAKIIKEESRFAPTLFSDEQTATDVINLTIYGIDRFPQIASVPVEEREQYYVAQEAQLKRKHKKVKPKTEQTKNYIVTGEYARKDKKILLLDKYGDDPKRWISRAIGLAYGPLENHDNEDIAEKIGTAVHELSHSYQDVENDKRPVIISRAEYMLVLTMATAITAIPTAIFMNLSSENKMAVYSTALLIFLLASKSIFGRWDNELLSDRIAPEVQAQTTRHLPYTEDLTLDNLIIKLTDPGWGYSYNVPGGEKVIRTAYELIHELRYLLVPEQKISELVGSTRWHPDQKTFPELKAAVTAEMQKHHLTDLDMMFLRSHLDLQKQIAELRIKIRVREYLMPEVEKMRDFFQDRHSEEDK